MKTLHESSRLYISGAHSAPGASVPGPGSPDRGLDRARRRMLRRHLAGRGIRDVRVMDAMAGVPREVFVPRSCRRLAYSDGPLPIGMGQTISQPYMVAWMAVALELVARDRVLEVGTGTGYSAAVLGRLGSAVYTVERHASLAHGARTVLDRLGYDNVRVRHGDGSLGWPEHAPFDAIVVAAGGPEVPGALRGQLARDGRLVMPVGPVPGRQVLVRERRDSTGRFSRERLGAVRFVPLVGEEGF